MTWLIAGGAGYIGSHVVSAARTAGLKVAILDDLSTGMPDRVPSDVPFINCDYADKQNLAAAIRDHQITGVVHLAAKKQVGESVAQPFAYWEWNVSRMITMLEVLAAHEVHNFVYSSSAAVYGNPTEPGLLTEKSDCSPINPYGATKLAGEVLIESLAVVGMLNAFSLRYFNVAGAADPVLADRLALNLVPIVLDKISRGEAVNVFGTDYPTPDGTCIRDYVHVADLAEAHVAAMQALDAGRTGHTRLNIGTGKGSSVLEVIAALEKSLDRKIDWQDAGRRAGDPAELAADASAAASVLNWQAKRNLQDICDSAWAAWPK